MADTDKDLFGSMSMDSLSKAFFDELKDIVEEAPDASTEDIKILGEKELKTSKRVDSSGTEVEEPASLIHMITDENEEIFTGAEEVSDENEQEESSEAEKLGDVASKDKSKEGGKPNSSSSPYKILASALVEEGVLPSLDLEKTEIKSTVDLINAIKDEIKQNEFKDLDETQKEYLEALRAGVATEVYHKHYERKSLLNSITEDVLKNDKEVREVLIYQDLIQKGFTEERAKKMTSRIFEAGEDIDEAKVALEARKQMQAKSLEEEKAKHQKQIEDAKNKQIEWKKKVESLATDSKLEIIPGFKSDERLRKAALDNITKEVGLGKDNKPLNAIQKEREKNPELFDYKVAYLFTLTKGFTDPSALVNKSKSKALDELDNKLRSGELSLGSTGAGYSGEDNDVEMATLKKLFG